MNRILIICTAIAVLFIAVTSHAQDKAPDWNAINTAGLYKKDHEKFIARDIWGNYTQDRALQTLGYFPKSLQSSAYRSVMEKLLFADSKPLKDDVKSPLLLQKRLNCR